LRLLNVKKEDIEYKDGIMSVKTDTGYTVKFPMTPMIGLLENLTENQQPIFNGNVQFGVLEQEVKPSENKIGTQQDLDKYLRASPVIPESLEWDDFLVGFIYSGNPQDQDNHKWFMQFRKNGQIFQSYIYANGIDIKVPVTSYSWNDGNWHGRLMVKRSDFEKLIEQPDNIAEIHGKKCGGYKEGDLSLIPDGCEILEVRYNIFTNKWYVSFLGKKDKKLEPDLVLDSISASIPMEAKTDRGHIKPKVTQRIKVTDIANILMISGNLTILGK